MRFFLGPLPNLCSLTLLKIKVSINIYCIYEVFSYVFKHFLCISAKYCECSVTHHSLKITLAVRRVEPCTLLQTVDLLIAFYMCACSVGSDDEPRPKKRFYSRHGGCSIKVTPLAVAHPGFLQSSPPLVLVCPINYRKALSSSY